jgi:hypothetical protein
VLGFTGVRRARMIGGSIPPRAKLSFGGFSFRCLPRTSMSRGLFVRHSPWNDSLECVRRAAHRLRRTGAQLAVHHTSQVFSRAGRCSSAGRVWLNQLRFRQARLPTNATTPEPRSRSDDGSGVVPAPMMSYVRWMGSHPDREEPRSSHSSVMVATAPFATSASLTSKNAPVP